MSILYITSDRIGAGVQVNITATMGLRGSLALPRGMDGVHGRVDPANPRWKRIASSKNDPDIPFTGMTYINRSGGEPVNVMLTLKDANNPVRRKWFGVNDVRQAEALVNPSQRALQPGDQTHNRFL